MGSEERLLLVLGGPSRPGSPAGKIFPAPPSFALVDGSVARCNPVATPRLAIGWTVRSLLMVSSGELLAGVRSQGAALYLKLPCVFLPLTTSQMNRA